MIVKHLPPKLAALGAFAATSLAIFVVLFRAAGGDVSPGHAYRVSVTVPTALNLVPNADVRAAGVRVGRVDELTARGAATELRLELDHRVAPVWADARVQVRTKTLVGESYVALEPGTAAAGALPDGGRIRFVDESVPLDEIYDALDPPTRRSVRRLLAGTATALRGRDTDLGASLGELRAASGDGERFTAVLAAQRQHLARLIEATGTVLIALGDRESDLRSLARSAETTATAIARRDERLASGVGALPQLLDQADHTVRALERFSGRAIPVVTRVRRGADDLGGALRALGPAALAGTRLVGELARTVPVADRLVAALARFSRQARPALPGAARALREVNPMLRHLAPYSREVGAFFANQGAWNEITDATGHIGRVQGVFSERTLAHWTPEMKRAIETLIDIGAVRPLHDQQTNAYPRPGNVDAPRSEGWFTRIHADRP